MKARLLHDTRLTHKAGEIVEVSTELLRQLVATGYAVEVAEKTEKKPAKK